MAQRPNPRKARIARIATLAVSMIAAAAAITAPVAAAMSTASSTGGAALGGLVPVRSRPEVPTPPSRHARGRWLRGVTITEYWPAPEAWFVGQLVAAPGLTGRHRVDWLYSASGISMQGDGIGLDGQPYHIQSLGNGGWVTAAGAITSPSDGWLGGSPFWRAGGFWRNRARGVTFPLAGGGWSAGTGGRYVALRGVTFAPGQSLPLRYYGSLAVDPAVIALGSRVYVPAYRQDGHGGWFVAQDTGGAISARHIDVYRPPPVSPADPGRSLTSQRIYVVSPPR